MRILLLCAALLATGCGARPTAARFDLGLDIAGHALLDIDDGVAIAAAARAGTCEARELPPPEHLECLAPVIAFDEALGHAWTIHTAARHGGRAVERSEANPGGAVVCVVGAVGNVLELAEDLRKSPGGDALTAWHAYAAGIGGRMCDLSPSGGFVERGGAEGETP